MISYPRRQRRRRLRRAAAHGARAVTALAAAVAAAGAGDARLAFALMLLSGASALASRRALRLAARSRVGAESEALVRRALAPLEREGWRVRHAVDWPGRGDVDHVAFAPSGASFVIETKTLRYTTRDLARVAEAARMLARPPRRRHPDGFRAVICLARVRRLERVAPNDVLVVSLDRLVRALLRDGPAR
jgi:hypothetical protein